LRESSGVDRRLVAGGANLSLSKTLAGIHNPVCLVH
jgi:hypothetical protein